MMKKSRDRFLGVAAMILLPIGTFYLLEYYVFQKTLFKKFSGIVSKSQYSTYNGYKRRLYGKSEIKLEHISKDFIYVDEVELGTYIDVQEGDTISIYGFSRFLETINFFYVPNTVIVQKRGIKIFDAFDRWRANLKMYMWIFIVAGILLSVMYLDVVKNISLENWFQKKVLKNPAYLNGKKKN